jgi:hypothetical protein
MLETGTNASLIGVTAQAKVACSLVRQPRRRELVPELSATACCDLGAQGKAHLPADLTNSSNAANLFGGTSAG